VDGGVDVGREVARMFGSQERVVLVPALVLVFGGGAVDAATIAAAGGLPANTADVDE
jgi:hypothetical protein